MATYNNSLPDDLHRSDIIAITTNVSLTFEKDVYINLDMNGAHGGASTNGYQGANAPGGRGGRLICNNMKLAAGVYNFVIGSAGGANAAGGSTSIKYGDTVIAEVLGGGGGTGAKRVVLDPHNGNTVVYPASAGAATGASVIPQGGTQYVGGSTSGGNGTIALTIVQSGAKPVIHCEHSGNLGTMNEHFSIPYTVSDAENNAVTVYEKLNGVIKRTHTPALGEPQEFQALMTHEFLKLPNGDHTLTIEAEDIGATADPVTLSFSKHVTACTVTLSEPRPADDMPTLVRLSVNGQWTNKSIWTAEVTNNAFDANPVWEDIKANVISGRDYQFTNTTKTADRWGVNFRLKFSCGPGDTGGYIYTSEGGFE